MTYLALAALMFPPIVASVPQVAKPYRNVPPHATICNGKLYGFFGTPGEQAAFGYTEYMLFAIPIKNPSPKKWEIFIPGAGGYGFRHRVSHQCVWFMQGEAEFCRLAVDELPLFDVLNPNRDKLYKTKYSDGQPHPIAQNHSFWLKTLFGKYREYVPGSLHLPDEKRVPGFGAVPTSGTSCKSYILNAETREMETWDTTFVRDQKKILWEPKPSPRFEKIDQWIKDLDSANFQKRARAVAELELIGYPANPALEKFLASNPSAEARRRAEELREKLTRSPWLGTPDYNYERFASLFAEDFHFFLRKDDYYFVTQSGKLYHAPPAKKGEKSRTMKSLWQGDAFPIAAVIEDADNDRVWLFTKSKRKETQAVYFEMAAEINVQKFDYSKLAPVNVEGRARPLLELLPLIRDKAKKQPKD